MAAAAPYIITSSALGGADRPAASERITLGCIGLGGRGTVNMETFLGQPEVQIVALCDVDAGSTRYEDAWHRGLAPAKEKVEDRYAAGRASGTYRGVSGYRDFRELLARDDIDAVCISTPDHWHAPMVVAAAQAGKDIYCEKPLSLTIRDGQAMVAAVQPLWPRLPVRQPAAVRRQVPPLVRTGPQRPHRPVAHGPRELARRPLDPQQRQEDVRAGAGPGGV